MQHLTINHLQIYSGIKAHTIRMWEKRYGLLQPQRTSINTRDYSVNDAVHFFNSVLLYQNGYRISKIATLTANELSESLDCLTDKEVLQAKAVFDLLVAIIKGDVNAIHNLIATTVERWELAESLRKVLLPFAEKAGLVWLRKEPFNYAEQITTQWLKQRLMQANAAMSSELNSKTALLFSLPDERSELALLYAELLLRSAGIRTIYAGHLLAAENTTTLLERLKPSLVIIHSIRKKNQSTVHEFQKIASRFTKLRLIFLGQQHTHLTDAYFMNCRFEQLEADLPRLLKAPLAVV